MVLWGLWGNRNALLHHSKPRSSLDLLGWVSGLLEDFQNSHKCLNPLVRSQAAASLSLSGVYWVPPPPGVLKLNSNVVVSASGGCIGLGVVIRNSAGWVVAAFSRVMHCKVSAEVGEFLALREGLLFAKLLNLSVGLLEVDLVNVASSINLAQTSSCVAGLIVEDILAFCGDVGVQKCLAIPRMGNSLAHNLASFAIASGRDSVWHEICPLLLVSVIV
ncbi:hypothetical protein ACOSQ3_024428 [Xanthoceras sorbifolium]